MDATELGHLERITEICWNRGEQIADLEARTIAQARTIEQQANVIRSHEAGDVIVMEALKAYAAEVAQLKEKVRYAYVQIKELESWK